MATKSLHAQLGASTPRREFPEPAAAPRACQVCVLKHFNFGPAELSQQVSCEEKLRNFLVLKLIRQHFCMGGSFLTLLVNFSSTVSSLRLLSKLPHEWEERMNTIKADHPLFLWERGSLFVFDSLTTVLSLLAARKNEVRDQGKPLYYNSRKSTGIPAFRSCRGPALKFTDCKFSSECFEAAAQGFHKFPAAMLPSKYFWFGLVF